VKKRRGWAPHLGETSNTKLQAPENLQIPNIKTQDRMPGQTARGLVLNLELGVSLELGVWNWELFAWALRFFRIGTRRLSLTDRHCRGTRSVAHYLDYVLDNFLLPLKED
jgi:hypothetical protein